MQRYRVETEDLYSMEPDPEGNWVLYEDALNAIHLAIENTVAFADQPKEPRMFEQLTINFRKG